MERHLQHGQQHAISEKNCAIETVSHRLHFKKNSTIMSETKHKNDVKFVLIPS